MTSWAEILFPGPAVLWRRLAVILWLVLLIGAFSRGLVKPTRGNVGGIYLEGVAAARHWVEGDPVYPRQWRWEMFPYGPALVISFIPLAALPDALGSGVWRLLVGLAYLAALAYWSRVALPRTLDPGGRALLFVLVLPVTASTVLIGQVGGLVAATLLLALAFAAEERWTLSAVFTVAACVLKVYPVAVALLLAATYPRRLVVRLLLVGLLAAALPFLFQSPGYVAEQYSGWVRLLGECDRHSWELTQANRNLSLLFRVWLVPLAPRVDLALQLLAAAGVALLCLAGQYRGWPHRRLLLNLLGLAGCWMTLFGPFVESYTYILIGPTLAWMLVDAWQERAARPPVRTALLLASWTVFAGASAAVWFGQTTKLHNLGPHPLAGLLLLAALLWNLLDQLRVPARDLPVPTTSAARAA